MLASFRFALLAWLLRIFAAGPSFVVGKAELCATPFG
jgi:hypothetical protein